MVLRAHACTLERSESQEDRFTRAAGILLDQRADAVVVTAALLTPPHRRGDLPSPEIKARFGDEISNLVVRASRDSAPPDGGEAAQSKDLRKWLRAISVDVRTLVLRVGLRVATLEALAEGPPPAGRDEDDRSTSARKTQDLARETLDLYVPLADRMGMGALRTRLEDASFHLLQPATHAEMTQSLERIRQQDQLCLSLLRDGVGKLLQQRGIDARLEGRVKGLYSIYRKMCRLDSPLDDVMDRIGLRIVVPSVEACYHVLGLLHTRFRPVPGTYDDYIRFPKENGYRSLHTCVYPVPDVSAKPVEFQIRTEAMHREAEYGVAAHWLYKNEAEAEAEEQRQLEKLRQLLPDEGEELDLGAFLHRLQRRVYDDAVMVAPDHERSMRLED
jgi:GTP pyrophosphokinase